MSNLFGVVLTEKKPAVIEVPEDRDLIITRAALSGNANGATVLSMQSEEIPESLVFGTLRSPACEQFELDCNIAAGSELQFSVKGPNEVHLTGYYNLRGPMEWDSDISSYDSEDEGGLHHLLDMGGYDSKDDSSFSQVESVEDSGDEEMGEDIIEESLSESPVKGKSPAAKQFPTEYFGQKVGSPAAAPQKPAGKKPDAKKPEAKPVEAKKPEASKDKKKKDKKDKKVAAAPAAETQGVKRPAPTTPDEKPAAKKQKTAPAASPAGASPGPTYGCSVCQKQFRSEVGRDSHQKAMHS